MGVLHLSPFTGTDGVDVDTLTPTTGAAMTYISGARMLVKDNRAYANGAAARYEINEAPTYPYLVTASVHVVSKVANELTTIQCRAATTSLNFYLNANAGTIHLSLGSLSASVTITAGNTYEMKILCHSATQTSCWLDGVALFGGMVTHANRGAVTKVRMLNEDAASSSTTGVHFDSITLQNHTTGSGAEAVAVPTMAGTGKQQHTGTGSLAAAAVLSGAGTRGAIGSGTEAVAPAFAGSGSVGVAGATGSGTEAVAPTMAGAGQQQHTGTGSLGVAPAVAGTGTRGAIGTGSLAVAVPSMAGTGQQQHTGTGSLAVAPAQTGTGTRGALGTGSLAVAPAVAGTGQQQHTGTGSVAASPTLAGSGQQQASGLGAISVALTLAATGTIAAQSSGGITITLVMGGAGSTTQQVAGTGYVVVPLLVHTATGTVEIIATADAKYHAEHTAALEGLADATGFGSDHASALRDLFTAGL